MSNFDALIWGQEFADSKAEFEKRLDEIEAKHQDWFADREDVVSGKKPDRLHNHHLFRFEPPRVSFGFRNDTEIPKAIVDECTAAFNDIFVSKEE